LNPIVAYVTGNVFEKVFCQSDTHTEDFWFMWPDDYEPIRIIRQDHRIVTALHRLHWRHITVDNPYSNDKSRIETIFIGPGHTPVIRKEKMDLSFYILIHNFLVKRLETYAVFHEDIPEYYTSSGKKDRHFPPVQYDGWPELR
jgi:hypothetical protein